MIIDVILSLTVLFLPFVTGQQIIDFDQAKSLKRDPEKGIFYAQFKAHQHHRLDVPTIKITASESRQECGQQCAETRPCVSFNLASATDVQGKRMCELLPTDIYNKSDKFAANPGFHHFSIKTLCSEKPCKNGGICVAKYEEDKYQCACVPGYEGTHCELDTDECVSSPCQNGGSCSDLVNRFVCACPPGYGGVYCEAVHGGYGSWGQWGSCDVTCGGGLRYRNRTCTNPPPQHGGNDCSGLGPNAESQGCNSNNNCPMHGGYSSWGQWSSCTVTCSVGTRSRSRTCTNPPPQYGGNDCSGLGLSYGSEFCKTFCCPGGCDVDQGSRTDCGYSGITESQCLAQAFPKCCCFDDSVPDGLPHCYNKRP